MCPMLSFACMLVVDSCYLDNILAAENPCDRVLYCNSILYSVLQWTLDIAPGHRNPIKHEFTRTKIAYVHAPFPPKTQAEDRRQTGRLPLAR